MIPPIPEQLSTKPFPNTGEGTGIQMTSTLAPEMGEGVRQLLQVADEMPIRMRERDRLIAAIDRVASEEWLWVKLALDQEAQEKLRYAQMDSTPLEMAHVLEYARTIAGAYNYEFVSVAHVAVALVVTSRSHDEAMIQTVSQAFGLGHLEQPGTLANRHHKRLNALNDQTEVNPRLWTTVAPGGRRAHQASRALYNLTHFGLLVTLIMLAPQSGTWMAWLILAPALFRSHDIRSPSYIFVEAIPKKAVYTRWPILPCVAVVATALGLWPQAEVITFAYFVMEGIAITGSYIQARAIHFEGLDIKTHGQYSKIMASLAHFTDVHTARNRIRVFLILLGTLFIVGIPIGILLPFWPILYFVTFFAAQRLTGLALVTAAMSITVFGWIPMLPLTYFALGIMVRFILALSRPLPRLRVSAPWEIVKRHPIGGLLTSLKARRMVRIGRPGAAVETIDEFRSKKGITTPSDQYNGLDVLRVQALLQSGHPGEAKRLARNFPPSYALYGNYIQGASALALGHPEDAFQFFQKHLVFSKSIRIPRRLEHDWRILAASLRINRGEVENIGGQLTVILMHRISSHSLMDMIVLLRMISEACAKRSPHLALMLATSVYMFIREERLEASYREFSSTDVSRPLDAEMYRASAHMLSLQAKLNDENLISFHSMVEGIRESSVGLLTLGLPLEAAWRLDELATTIQNHPAYRLEALEARIDALATLNHTRHSFIEREDRIRWWAVFNRTLEQALQQATNGRDWLTVAELIESARLQSDPSQQNPNNWNISAQSPFITVRGISRLENSLWHGAASRPETYDLEVMSQLVLGHDTCWWGMWDSETSLYWSFVPPQGDVMGGCIPLKTIHGVLKDLADALPIPYPEEDNEDFTDRWENGPLSGPRRAELEFSKRLAVLIPDQVRRYITTAKVPLSIAIAPSPLLAHVPWSVVSVVSLEQESLPKVPDLRLIECANIAIAPPAILLAEMMKRQTASEGVQKKNRDTAMAAPIAAAVVDPGGDLPNANALLKVIPPQAHVLSNDDLPTARDFSELLRNTPHEATLLYAGHAMPPTTADEVGGALYLGSLSRDGHVSPDKSITADALIAQKESFPVPEQFLLLACGSGDFQSIQAGEWVTLGPAFLWAGAHRGIVTLFPIVDETVLDAGLIRQVGYMPLHAALREMQLQLLASWRRTGKTGEPIYWASYIPFGSFGIGPKDSMRRNLSNNRYISKSLLELIDSAAELANRKGEHVVDARHLFAVMAWYGWDEDVAGSRRILASSLRWGTNLWSVARDHVRSLRHRRVDTSATVGTVEVSDEIIGILRVASDLARASHHRTILIEHLLVGLLKSEAWQAQVMRAVSGWDTRQPDVVKSLLTGQDNGWLDTGLASVGFLSQSAVAAIYESVEIVQPVALVDRWYFTDR